MLRFYDYSDVADEALDDAYDFYQRAWRDAWARACSYPEGSPESVFFYAISRELGDDLQRVADELKAREAERFAIVDRQFEISPR